VIWPCMGDVWVAKKVGLGKSKKMENFFNKYFLSMMEDHQPHSKILEFCVLL